MVNQQPFFEKSYRCLRTSIEPSAARALTCLWAAQRKQRNQSKAACIDVFVTGSGPYDGLFQQVLDRIAGPALHCTIRLVPASEDLADPLMLRKKEWAQRDAGHWARFWDLKQSQFADSVNSPWQQIDSDMQKNQALLDRGHIPAVPLVRYGKESFVGIERIPYLLHRLQMQKDFDRFPMPTMNKLRSSLSNKHKIALFFSFRSPYSYLALKRIHRAGLAEFFALKPVAPMVTRGVPLPSWKKNYILMDSARMAEWYGVPFGKILDPLGNTAVRCLHISSWLQANHPNLLFPFALAAMTASWSKGQNPSKILPEVLPDDADWNKIMIDSSFLEWSANNRLELEQEHKHWGVPTFVSDKGVFWGQDRLGLF